MGNTVPLRHIHLKLLRQLCSGLLGHGISPGAKWNQQFILLIKCHIAMHHSTDSQRGQLLKRHPVLPLHFLCQNLITRLQSCMDCLQTVGPDTIHQLIFPLIRTHRQCFTIFIHKHCLDPGRTKLNAKCCFSVHNTFFCIHSNDTFLSQPVDPVPRVQLFSNTCSIIKFVSTYRLFYLYHTTCTLVFTSCFFFFYMSFPLPAQALS